MVALTVAEFGEERSSIRGILRGGSRPGDVLREMGSQLCNGPGLGQRQWIIDNRALESPLPLVDLARFAHLARTHPTEIAGLRIAWVSNRSLSHCLRSMIAELPLEFAEFEELDAAHRWLHASD